MSACFFETALARRAAKEASDADIEQLRHALKENEAAVGDRPRFIETDVAFHFVLANMAGNPVFRAIHDGMSSWLKQQRVITLDIPEQERIALKAHKRIFDAIRKRDPDAAENAMHDHLMQLQAAYWAHEAAEADK